MRKMTIPGDWNGEDFETWLVCVPKSQGWRVVFRTAVLALTRGRQWDENTGSIIGAQSAGWMVYDSMGTCDGIETMLQRIAVALEAMGGVGQLQLDAQIACCERDAVDTALDVQVPPSGQNEDGGYQGENSPPDGWLTWAGWNCASGFALVDEYIARLEAVDELWRNGVKTLAALLDALTRPKEVLPEGVPVNSFNLGFIIGVAAEIWSMLVDPLLDNTLAAWAETMRTGEGVRNALACAWASSGGWESGKAAFKAELGTYIGEIPAYLVSLMVPDELLQALWVGYYTLADGATVDIDLSKWADETCDCVTPSQWVAHMSSGYCQESLFDESVNTFVSLAGDVELSRSGNTSPYVFYVDRNTVPLAGGETFNVGVNVSNGVTVWYWRQYFDGDMVQETRLDAGVPQAIAVAEGGCDRVVLYRNDELYNQSCPRMFAFTLSATCTDLAWTQEIEG